MDYSNQSFKFPWMSWHLKSYKDVSLLCVQEEGEWYSICPAILCQKNCFSTPGSVISTSLVWYSCDGAVCAPLPMKRVWPKLQLPGVLCSKPDEDITIIYAPCGWHTCRWLLLLFSAWQLLTALYVLFIWLGFHQVSVFGLKLKPGTKRLCGLSSVPKGLRQQQLHEQCHYCTLAGQKLWWGIEREEQEPCKKKVGETASMRTGGGKGKCGETLSWRKTEMKILTGRAREKQKQLRT